MTPITINMHLQSVYSSDRSETPNLYLGFGDLDMARGVRAIFERTRIETLGDPHLTLLLADIAAQKGARFSAIALLHMPGIFPCAVQVIRPHKDTAVWEDWSPLRISADRNEFLQTVGETDVPLEDLRSHLVNIAIKHVKNSSITSPFGEYPK